MPWYGLLAWVFIPLMYLGGKAPAADDVTKFLDVSGANPLIVISVVILLAIVMFFIAYKRGIIKCWLDLIKEMKTGGDK